MCNATENEFQYIQKSKLQYIPTISEKRKRMGHEKTRHGFKEGLTLTTDLLGLD